MKLQFPSTRVFIKKLCVEGLTKLKQRPDCSGAEVVKRKFSIFLAITRERQATMNINIHIVIAFTKGWMTFWHTDISAKYADM